MLLEMEPSAARVLASVCHSAVLLAHHMILWVTYLSEFIELYVVLFCYVS